MSTLKGLYCLPCNDVVFLSCDYEGNWNTHVYNDIIGYENEDDRGTYMSINFLDCDNDQIYYKYIGKAVGYSSPTLYSVIQTPPYYSEANSASISYTVTHGNASSTKGNWGISIGLGTSKNTGIFRRGMGTGKYLGYVNDTTSKSTSTTLKLRADQDYAVSFVISAIENRYLVYDPNANNGNGEWGEEVTFQYLEPVLSALPLDTYNELASKLTDEEQKKVAPVIIAENLPKSSVGDPHGYCNNIDELQEEIRVHQNDKGKLLETDVFVNNDTDSKSNAISITDSHDVAHGFNLSINLQFCIFKALDVQFIGEGGVTCANSNSQGISFSITYGSLPSENKGNINTSTSQNYTDYKDINGNYIQNNINHYEYVNYTYYSNAVVYPSNSLGEGESVKNGVYLCSYYTHDFGGTPAELPEYFGVQSVTQNPDGTYNITLAWKTSVKNENRKPDAYNIYAKSLNANSVNLVNTEGPILRNNNSIIMTYEAKNLSNSSKDYVFYIASANTQLTNGASSSHVMNVYESILQPAPAINVENFLTTNGLKITSQPENFLIKEIGDNAEFLIDAEDTLNDAKSVNYQWETYNSKSKKWNAVTNNKSKDPKKYVFETTESSIGTPIRCVITKTKTSGESYVATSDVVTVLPLDKHKHNYNDNGFCTLCNGYEPAEYNAQTNTYEISNAGQLFWFASLVNGDNTLAEFDSQNQSANAVLTKDIDLKSKEWTPIKEYKGNFDGNNHTISNLKITNGKENIGLFGSVQYGTITNLVLKGNITLHDNANNVGSLVGHMDGGTVSNVSSYVSISNPLGVFSHVGGIVGDISGPSISDITKCMYLGKLDAEYSTDSIGGIIGHINGRANIIDCANIGTVTATRYNAFVGGILGYINDPFTVIETCYNYGKVTNSGINGDNYCGAIIGFASDCSSANITENYYLIDSAPSAFGATRIKNLVADGKPITAFESGEVTYLLNHSVSGGENQVWFQNIDNEQTPDPYPVFTGGTVYLIYDGTYSNTEKTKPVTPEFEKDENGNLLIKTYDDLVTLAELVKSDYKNYGTNNYILVNNIVAPNNSEWTQGIGSISENKPFNGTFDGNGHFISGLNINSPENGGLFEIIGNNGTVKNLFLFDCDYLTQSKTAGAIAAVNNGTIDHCINGVNFTSGIIYIGDYEIDSVQKNSYIKGAVSGGIVGINNGTVTGSRNTSVVAGTNCGGIVGENNGKIFGSANNGKVGSKTDTTVAGGLVGTNKGSIESSYNTGTVYGKTDESKGSVAGINSADVKKTHYLCTDGLNAVGTSSSKALDSTNVLYTEPNSMRDPQFTNTMTEATGTDSIVWKANALLNKGYPTIQIVDFTTKTVSAGNGITLKGSVHDELNISYKNKDSKEFEQLKSKYGNKVMSTYSVNLTDKNGNYVPAELWCEEYFELSVPVSKNNIQLASVNENGEVSYYAPSKVENGNATFNVPYPTSFAIIETDIENTNGTVTPSDSTPIKTGAMVCTALFAILMLSGVVFVTVKRRNKFD